MKAQDIMARDPACCAPDDFISAAARLMVQNDCGQIPVVDVGGMLIGVVTDRDIACRCVAEGKTLDTRVEEIMSKSVVTVKPDASLDECCRKMEDNQVRRLPVVDDTGRCCGLVSQADIANYAKNEETGDLVRQVSESRVYPAVSVVEEEEGVR